MALEDLNLKINVGMLNAESSLASLGKIESEIGRTQHRADGLAKSVGIVSSSLGKIETEIGRTQHRAEGLATTVGIASSSLMNFGGVLGFVGGTLGTVGGVIKAGAGSLLHLVHMVHAAHIVVDLLTTAFVMLMVPIRMIGSAAMMVFGMLRAALGMVLLPVKILWAGLSMVARVIFAIITPLIGLAAAAFKVWFVFKGWIGALKVLWGWLGMLPPKLRLVVGGLLLLGATGKVGALALRVVAGAARLAATAFQVLSIPILLCTNPVRALTVAASLLGRALLATANMALRAATSMWSFATSVGSAVGSVVGMIGGKLLSAAKAGATAFLMLGAATAAWGIKLAAKAETGAVVFGTMLKNMQQGKALQADLESWSGAPLFDADAVQLSGVLLFKAGIAANGIKDKLNQLGQVAAATKTPLDELATIYQQGMNQGAFQQDKINQLSDRGIAIYEGLAHATGKSGLALKEMIRDGKIGPAEMNAALEHLTTGHGIYAGAIENIGGTTEGMWKKLKNTVAFVAREIGINIMDAFDFKGMMAGGISFFSNLKSQISNAMPAFMAAANVVKAYFFAIMEAWSVVAGMITSALGLTGGNWMKTFLEMAAIATWAFKNWPDIATLAFMKLGLYLVQAGSQFTHLFTGILPTLFSWFSENWSSTFLTAASFVGNVFMNMQKQIFAIMKGIWEFIASGGKKSLSIAWVPLLDGFKNTMSKMPDIPPRAIGQLEAQLAADSDRLASALGGSLADEIASNMKMLEDFQKKQANAVSPTLDDTSSGGEGGGGEDPIGTASKKAAENKAVFARSSEGQSVVTQFLRGFMEKDDTKVQTAAAVATAASLKNIERDTRRGKTLESRGFG